MHMKERLSRWCSQQDRPISKTKEKARNGGLNENEVEDLIQELLDQQFLDDARYAESFVRGKFEFKQWGPIKIKHHLRAQGVDSRIIDEAIQNNIAKAKREQKLRELIEKKTRLDQPDKPRMVRFLQSKGYALDEILSALD